MMCVQPADGFSLRMVPRFVVLVIDMTDVDQAGIGVVKNDTAVEVGYMGPAGCQIGRSAVVDTIGRYDAKP